jgi:thiol-disulfide isomerase/thioredoxin
VARQGWNQAGGFTPDDRQRGTTVPDLELSDHAGTDWRLGELTTGGHPTVLNFYRGWWCPREQRFMRNLMKLREEMEVAYTRIVSVTGDPPEISPGSERVWVSTNVPAGFAASSPRGTTSSS